MVTTPLARVEDRSAYGTVVDDRTYALFHQHFIVAKLDLDIDGADNSVLEVESVAAPMGPDNPYGLAVTTEATMINSERESARDYSWESQRAWKVINPNRTNRHGDHPGYKLVPGAAIPALFDPAAPVYQRAPVIGHSLWVTAYNDAERWPAGDYPTQSAGLQHRAGRAPTRHQPLGPRRRVVGPGRRRALVRLRHPPHHPARGLADHARRHDLLLAQAVGFFDQNPALDIRILRTTSGSSHTPDQFSPVPESDSLRTGGNGQGVRMAAGQSIATIRSARPG